MAGIDTLLGAAVDSVKRSGALEAGALSAVVTAVASDGTLTVTHGQDTYPRVRLLSGYSNPTVGATVQILKTAGGWVCLGAQVTANPSAWINIPMTSAWATQANYVTPSYRVFPDRSVRFRGVADHTAAFTTPATIGTLPVGVRPPIKYRFITQLAPSLYASLDVNQDGTIMVGDFTGTASYAVLFPVHYYLD